MGQDDDNIEPPGELQENVCTEARLTLNQQLSRIEKYDKKAVGLFRSNILLAGVLLSGLTVVVRTDGIEPTDFVNVWGIAGAFSLGFSTVLCAMAYTSSSYALGITSNTIDEVEEGIYAGTTEFNNELRGLYKQWLDYNANTGSFNSYLITGGIILLMNSIGFFIGAVAIVLSPVLKEYSSLLFIISLSVIIIADTLVYSAEWLYKRIYGDIQ